MPRKIKRRNPKEDDMTIGDLAQMINSAFIKQDESLAQVLDQKLAQNRQEIMDEIDARDYVSKKDLDKTLDERGYATAHDLQDAIIDVKDEIIAHIDHAISPKLDNHERRITRLEQKV